MGAFKGLSAVVTLGALGLLFCGSLQSAGMTVGSGATISLGGGTSSLGCGDLSVAGTLNLGSGAIDETASVVLSGTVNGNTGAITFGNDWNKSGTFNAGASQVTLNDDCGDGVSLFQGDTGFNNFSINTAAGKTWSLTAGSTQNIANALVLAGQGVNLLTIRSTSSGNPAFLELAAVGSQSIDRVDVQDNHALGPPGQWLAPGPPASYNSVDSGGNNRWFGGTGIARFEVAKIFSDGNPAEVEVTISCNTGLPLEQSHSIDQSNNVTFVVTEFDSEELDCSITETIPDGYEAYYDNGLEVGSEVACEYEDVADQARFTCTIVNELQPVAIEVTKIWQETHPEYGLPKDATARWECFNAQAENECPTGPIACENATGSSNPTGWLSFSGAEDSDSFQVLPRWDGTTYCHVEEVGHESDVEVDDSDCDSVGVLPGSGNSCTIYNLRFFEGIPALNPYGLALLALLLLGMGWVGLRRFE